MNSSTKLFRACRSSRAIPYFLESNNPTSTCRTSIIPIRQFTISSITRASPTVTDISTSSSTTIPPQHDLPQTTLSRQSNPSPPTTEPPTQSSPAIQIPKLPPSPPSSPPTKQSKFTIVARVTRVGTMRKTVRVTRNIQIYDRHLRKYYTKPHHELVHDPEEVLVEGDVIKYGLFSAEESAERKQRRAKAEVEGGKNRKRLISGAGVRWVFKEIVTPFGIPFEERVRKSDVKDDDGVGLGAVKPRKTPGARQRGAGGRKQNQKSGNKEGTAAGAAMKVHTASAV